MTTQTSEKLSPVDFLIGWLASAAASALGMALFLFAATPNESFFDAVIFLTLVLAPLLSLGPLGATLTSAAKRKAYEWWFYVLGGAAGGVFYVLVFAIFALISIVANPSQKLSVIFSFLTTLLLTFMAPGAAGGLGYWLYARFRPPISTWRKEAKHRIHLAPDSAPE